MSGPKPIEPITSDDHCGYIVLAIYASFFVTLLFWVVRIGVRWRKLGLKLDDVFLYMRDGACAVAKYLHAVSSKRWYGEQGDTGEVHREDFEKRFYAANLLNILSQACAKISVALMFHQLQPFRGFAIASFASLALAAAWGISSFFALAFQCDVPNPWKLGSGRCVNVYEMLLGIDITNIISEASLIAVPAFFLPKIKTDRSIHFIVISCFAARLGVIAPLIGHIIALPNPLNYADATWAFLPATIWFQVAMNASILTACIPGMQQILAELRSGLLMVKVGNTDCLETSRYGAVFGTVNSNRIHTDISKADSKLRELARMDSRAELKRTSEEKAIKEEESDRRLAGQRITITKRVDQIEEFR